MLYNLSNPITCLNDLHPRNSHLQDVLKIDSVYKIKVFSNLTLLKTNEKKCMNLTNVSFTECLNDARILKQI